MCLGTAYLTIAHAPLGNKVQNHCLSIVFLNSIRYMLVRIGIKCMEFAHARVLSKKIVIIFVMSYLIVLVKFFCPSLFCLFDRKKRFKTRKETQ